MTAFESLLNHTFTIYRQDRTDDGQGGWSITYVVHGSAEGRIRPASSAEREVAAKEERQISHVLYVVHGTDILRGDLVIGDGLAVGVQGVREPSRAGAHLEIDALETQSGAPWLPPVALDTELANMVFAGPAAGPAAIPAFRALVVADIPAAIARDAEVTAAIGAHAGAADPHGDRAFTTAAIGVHAGAADPHGDRAFASGLVTGAVSGVANRVAYFSGANAVTGSALMTWSNPYLSLGQAGTANLGGFRLETYGNAAPFAFTTSYGVFGGFTDDVMGWGYNTNGTGKIMAGVADIGWNLEADYYDGASHRMEWNMSFTNPGGGYSVRPLSMWINRDATSGADSALGWSFFIGDNPASDSFKISRDTTELFLFYPSGEFKLHDGNAPTSYAQITADTDGSANAFVEIKATGGTTPYIKTINPIYGTPGSTTIPGYSFFGDPDTGFSNSAGNTISAVIGGANTVQIDAAGIGIFTAPSYPLHIVKSADGSVCAPAVFNTNAGTAAIASSLWSVGTLGSGQNAQLLVFGANYSDAAQALSASLYVNSGLTNGLSLSVYPAAPIKMYTNHALRLTIAATGEITATNSITGSVLAGTTSAGAPLLEATGTGGSVIRLVPTTSTTGFGNTIYWLRLSDSWMATQIGENYSNVGYGANLVFATNRSASPSDVVEAMRLTYLGSALIGTATDGMTAGGSLAIAQDLAHRGTKAGFFNTAPVNRPTGVAVSAAGIHAALVTLGLITA